MDFSHIMSGFPARCSVWIGRLMRRLVQVAATVMSKVCLAVLRAVVAGVVFSISAMLTMHYLGLPVQVPPEVLDTLESLGRLAKILS